MRKVEMPKPTQYFIDKSEALNISNRLKEHLNDQEILIKQVRSQSFVNKQLYSLAATSLVENPYDEEVVVEEVKQQMERYKTNAIYQKPDNVPTEVNKAESYVAKHQKAFEITENFTKELEKLGGPQEPPEIHLGDIQIAHKREAVLFNDRVELKPTVFELPKIETFTYSKDPNAFVEDKDVEELREIEEKQKGFSPKFALDNRIPLRVIQVEQYQEQVKKTQNVVEVQSENPNDENVKAQGPEAKRRPQELDHSDFAVNSHFLKKTSERMLGTVQQISNHKYFIEGKCECQCHSEPNEGRRICNICLCKLENDDDTDIGINQNFQSNNLLKNTNLPLYVIENEEENILMTDGRLTRGEVLDLIHHELDEMGPDKRILHVAREEELLADKVWSPKLRSDISPQMKANELENIISEAHLEAENSQIVQENVYTTGGMIKMNKRHSALASELMVTGSLHDSEVLERKKLESAEDDLRRKLSRQTDDNELLQMRKTEASGVQKIIDQSIMKASSHPKEEYQHYEPPPERSIICKDNVKNRQVSRSPKGKTSVVSTPQKATTQELVELDENDIQFFEQYENEPSEKNEAANGSNRNTIFSKTAHRDDSTGHIPASTDASNSCLADRESGETSMTITNDSLANDYSNSQTRYQSELESSAFSYANELSNEGAAHETSGRQTAPNNEGRPPYEPSNRTMSPDYYREAPAKYLEPSTVDRLTKTRRDEEIDYQRVQTHEKMKKLITDPALPEMTEKQYQRIINKAYDRLEDLNEYVELKMIYCKEPINFNDYTELRKKHVKSSLK